MFGQNKAKKQARAQAAQLRQMIADMTRQSQEAATLAGNRRADLAMQNTANVNSAVPTDMGGVIGGLAGIQDRRKRGKGLASQLGVNV